MREGARRVLEVARRGEPSDLRLAAVLAALGALEAPDWSAAVAFLDEAARGGDEGARREREVLATLLGGGGTDPGKPNAPVPTRTLSASPPVRAVDGFAPPEVCAWLIGRAAGRIAPSQVFDPATGGAAAVEARTNGAFQFTLLDLDLVVLAVRERIAATLRLPVAALEPVQVFRYEVGERFAPHFDFLDEAVEGYAADVRASGQRLATFLVYLNADFEGGETEFPELGLSHRGGIGDALMFANLDREGRPDRRTLHAGVAPTAGTKWLLSQWARDRAQR